MYSGDRFSFIYRIASPVNVVFVTMFWGPAFPILFPIAVICIQIEYIKERLAFAYSYRTPPNYNRQFLIKCIIFIRNGALLCLLSSAQLMSNSYVFENDVEQFEGTSISHPTEQTFWRFMSEPTYYTPQMVVFFLAWAYLLVTCRYCFISWRPDLTKAEFDNKQVNYFDSLKIADKARQLQEEAFFRELTGISKISFYNVYNLMKTDKLNLGDGGKGQMVGIHCYDMLLNPIYKERFMYTPCYCDDDPCQLQEGSEQQKIKYGNLRIARLVVDFAYMTRRQQRSLCFACKSSFENLKYVNAEQSNFDCKVEAANNFKVKNSEEKRKKDLKDQMKMMFDQSGKGDKFNDQVFDEFYRNHLC